MYASESGGFSLYITFEAGDGFRTGREFRPERGPGRRGLRQSGPPAAGRCCGLRRRPVPANGKNEREKNHPRCRLLEKGFQLDRLLPQSLHGAVRSHGNVQIVYQIPDGPALGADDGSLTPAAVG